MKRLYLIAVLPMLLMMGCRKEAPVVADSGQVAATPEAVEAVPAFEELTDVVETDRRYIIGISYPPAVNKYPGLATELKAYSDAAHDDLMEAVSSLGPDAEATLYDLSLEYKVIADTPEVFAVAADGTSYTGGAHGTPLIARFVWLPQQNRRLVAAELIPRAESWSEVSAYVREQLLAALSQRVDADDLDPGERERVVRSAGKLIQEGSMPEPDNFAEFEPVLGVDGRLSGLRFVFPPYQVGPYSDGVQTVEMPASVLLPHIAAEYRPLFSGAAGGQ